MEKEDRREKEIRGWKGEGGRGEGGEGSNERKER